jgi:hypothetical protein
MKTSALISAVLVAALLSMGPFAPVVTLAQAQMQPVQPQQVQPVPPPPMPPPPMSPQTMQPVPPVGPTDPSLTSQAPGQEVQPVNPSESVTNNEPTPGDATAAGFMNVVYVPGKAIICTAGVLTSTLLLLLTFGSAYRAARGVFQEGCSSPWVLTAEHVSGKIPGPGDPGYDSAGRY